MFLHLSVILFTGEGHAWEGGMCGRGCAKVLFLHLSVSHSVHRRGLHPGGLYPAGVCIQRGLGRTQPHRILWDTTINERVVRVLQECILVFNCDSNSPPQKE